VEHALDPQYAKKLGVNLDELLVSQPSSVKKRSASARRWSARMRST
jgi:RecA/RadA recombinase